MTNQTEGNTGSNDNSESQPLGTTPWDIIAHYSGALFVDYVYATIFSAMAIFFGWLARGIETTDSHRGLLHAMAISIAAAIIIFIWLTGQWIRLKPHMNI